MVVDPAVEARAGRAPQGLARSARRQGRQSRPRRPGARGQGRPQHHGAVDRLRQGRRHHRRMGRHAAPGVRRVPRPDRRRAGGRRAEQRGARGRARRRSRRLSAKLGRRIKFLVGKPGLDGHSNGAEQIAVRARDCRHGGRLRGHPPDAGADRARGARRERARGRAVDPVGQPRAAGLGGHGAHAQGRARRRPRRRRRHHPARGRGHAQVVRRRRGLHAEGLPAQRHHGRHRAAGVGANRWQPEAIRAPNGGDNA